MNFIGLMLHWLNFFWTVIYSGGTGKPANIVSATKNRPTHPYAETSNGRFEHSPGLPPFTTATKQSTYEIKELQTYSNRTAPHLQKPN